MRQLSLLSLQYNSGPAQLGCTHRNLIQSIINTSNCASHLKVVIKFITTISWHKALVPLPLNIALVCRSQKARLGRTRGFKTRWANKQTTRRRISWHLPLSLFHWIKLNVTWFHWEKFGAPFFSSILRFKSLYLYVGLARISYQNRFARLEAHIRHRNSI